MSSLSRAPGAPQPRTLPMPAAHTRTSGTALDPTRYEHPGRQRDQSGITPMRPPGSGYTATHHHENKTTQPGHLTLTLTLTLTIVRTDDRMAYIGPIPREREIIPYYDHTSLQ